MATFEKWELERTLDAIGRAERLRSASGARAIVRIVREQISARGHLGVYPKLAVGLVSVVLLAGGATTVVSETIRAQLLPIIGGFGFVAAAVAWGAISNRDLRRTSAAEERAIRQTATRALEGLEAEGIFPHPLEERVLADFYSELRPSRGSVSTNR